MAELLLSLLFIIVAVTLVGHGIWVAVATIVKALSAQSQPPQSASHDCPVCGQPRGVVNGRCWSCGATPLLRAGSARSDDLAATIRELDRLVQNRSITPELRGDLVSVLRNEAEPADGLAQSEQGVSDAGRAEPRHPEQPAEPAAAERSSPAEAGVETSHASTEESHASADEPVIVAAEVVEEPAESDRVAPDTVHPLDQPEAQHPAPSPSRPLASLLQAFMEEKNIRWGEIMAGLVIVFCAVGLVISLWAQLREAIPYLPAFIFMLGTGAFHAAGQYTLRRWDLQSISRAVLIIGTLLIPLNFVAAIALTGLEGQRHGVTDPTFILAVLVGLSAYSIMTYFAGRALLGDSWWRLAIAVMGTSAGQLIINRGYQPGASTVIVSLLIALPLASFLVATVGYVWRARLWKRMSPRRAQPLLLVLGIGTFSFLAPVCLLVAKAPSPEDVLAQLTPSLSLVGAAILGTGLLIDRRTTSAKLGALRTAGTSLAFGGSFLLLLMVFFAWPDPQLLIAVGLVNALLLALLGSMSALAPLHFVGVGCAALAYLVAFHLLRGAYREAAGTSREMILSLVSGHSSAALAVLAGVSAAAAFWLRRRGRSSDSLGYFSGSAALAVLSILLALVVGYFSWPGSSLAAPVLLVFALVAGAGGWILHEPRLSGTASALLLAGIVQALAFNEPVRDALAWGQLLPRRPVLVALLAHAAICTVLAILAGRRDAWTGAQNESPRWRSFVDPLSISALATSLLAAPWVLWVSSGRFGHHSAFAFALAAIWLSAALLRAWPPALYVGQFFTAVALSYAATALCQQAAWWNGQFFAPRHIVIQLGVLAAWSLVWSLPRLLLRRRQVLRQLMPHGWATVDQIVLGGVVLGLFAAASYGCAAGVFAELGFLRPSDTVVETSHSVFYSVWAWAAFGIASAALIVGLLQRPGPTGLAGAIVLGATVPLLLAGPAEEHAATASTLRWLLAGYGLLLAAVQAAWRAPSLPHLRGENPILSKQQTSASASLLLLLLLGLLLSVVPVLALTTLALYQVSTGAQLGGPLTASWFHGIGTAWSYGTPLGLVTLTLLVHAVSRRQAVLALAGSLVFQYLATLACLLPALISGVVVDNVLVAQLVQWNTVALGCYALVWLALRGRIDRPPNQSDLPGILPHVNVTVQVFVLLAVVSVLAIWAAGSIVVSPARAASVTTQLGAWSSYVALVLAILSASWCWARTKFDGWPHLASGALFAGTSFLAATVSISSTPQNWLAFHVLLGGWTVAAAAVTGLACLLDRSRRTAASYLIRWATVFGVLAVLLSLLACNRAPGSPWWSVGSTGTVAVLAAVLGFRFRRQVFAYASIFLVASGVTFYWVDLIWPFVELAQLVRLSLWLLLSASLSAAVWLLAEVGCQQREARSFQPDFRGLPVHRFMGVAGVILFALTVCGGFTVAMLERTFGTPATVDVSGLWSILATVALGALLFGTFWDRTSQHTLPCLYAWGLAALTLLIDAWELEFAHAVLAVALAVSFYVALTGALWWYGANLAAWGSRWGISDPVQGLRSTARWLPVVNSLFSWSVALIALVIVLLYEERQLRMMAGLLPALLALGIGSLAQTRRREVMQYMSLMLAALAGVYASWADIEPASGGAVWLDRAIRLLIVLCTVAFLYSVVVARRIRPSSDWRLAVKRAAVTVGGAALLVLAAILLLEAGLFLEDPEAGAPVETLQLVVVSVVMVGLVAALLAMAVLEGRDPLGLSLRGRMLYVYAAQAAGALLFAHIYLSRPEWFSGLLRQYWPYIVIGIAFAGTGAGELFQRFRLRVLADPMQRTGAFLPLIPALGMWVLASQSNYSLLLFSIGLLYIFLSISRKSTLAALAAAVAGNGALWSLLEQRGFVLWQQPQLWMIPPAVSVLAAAEVNRRRLSEETLTAVRYACMLVIYASSAGEMFLRGIGQQLWPPMVLLSLSVTGALAGVALRIRAFLYLGITFVFLSVISMVWHAARAIDHVWPWWAFGIALGLAILVLFGVFEKKRDSLTKMAKQLRHWEQ